MMEFKASVLIAKAEGFRGDTYRCPAGKLTTWYGRNLEVYPFTNLEESIVLGADKKEVVNYAFDWVFFRVIEIKERLEQERFWLRLSDERRAVCIDMCFNLGIKGFLGFKKMIKALEEDAHIRAAAEMEDSKWFRQVGNRGKRNVAIMRDNKIADNTPLDEPIYLQAIYAKNKDELW